jgi:hypothetical protein
VERVLEVVRQVTGDLAPLGERDAAPSATLNEGLATK